MNNRAQWWFCLVLFVLGGLAGCNEPNLYVRLNIDAPDDNISAVDIVVYKEDYGVVLNTGPVFVSPKMRPVFSTSSRNESYSVDLTHKREFAGSTYDVIVYAQSGDGMHRYVGRAAYLLTTTPSPPPSKAGQDGRYVGGDVPIVLEPIDCAIVIGEPTQDCWPAGEWNKTLDSNHRSRHAADASSLNMFLIEQ